MSSEQIAATEILYFRLRPDWLITLTSIFIVLVTICIALRFYVRAILIKSIGKDDWVLLLAFLVFLADSSLFLATGIIEKSVGLTRVVYKLELLTVASSVLYLADQICIKLALAYFFLRIVNSGWQRLLIISSVSLYTLYTFVFSFIIIFECATPTAAHYASGQCLSWPTVLGPLNYLAATLNAVMDWILVLTPISVVARSSASRREKASVYALILLGLAGSVVSLIRIPYISGVAPTRDLSFFSRSVPIALCSIAENAIGLMAICLSACRPLYARLVGATRSRFGTSKGESGAWGMRTLEEPKPAAARMGRGRFSRAGYWDMEKGGARAGVREVTISGGEREREGDGISVVSVVSVASVQFPIQKE